MPAIASVAEFVAAMHRCGLPARRGWEDLARRAGDAESLARELARAGFLTPFQSRQCLNGRGDDLVLGPFLLLEQLGAGGMGAVFKAQNKLMGRTVALKLMLPALGEDAEVVARFRQEVEAVAKLSHPNIVTALHAESGPRGLVLVMEYCDGRDLGRAVRDTGPFAVARACDCVSQAALGLQHAHERGLVHRDVKPSNLLLTADGQVKILDFGLARLFEDGNTERLTHTGAAMGTPDFMAPEQARDSSAVDVRGDIYSLGCTLYFLLAGRAPFPGGTPWYKISRHQNDEPEPIESLRPPVPPELAVIVRRMMAKDPAKRFQLPADVVAALAPFHAPAPPTQARVEAMPPTRRVIPPGAELPRVVRAAGDSATIPSVVREVPAAESSSPFDFSPTPAPVSDPSMPTTPTLPPVPPDRAPERRKRVWPWWGAAVAGLLLVAAVVVALLPRNARDDRSVPTPGGPNLTLPPVPPPDVKRPPDVKPPPDDPPPSGPLPKGAADRFDDIPTFRLALHPDGDVVAVARGHEVNPVHGGVELWSAKQGKRLGVLVGGRDHPPVFAVAFSADGRYFAYGVGALNVRTPKARVAVYQVHKDREWERLTEFETKSDGIRSLAFPPKSNSNLVVGSYARGANGRETGGLEMWYTTLGWQTARPRSKPSATEGSVNAIAFNPSGPFGFGFAAAGWDATVRYWPAQIDPPSFNEPVTYRTPAPTAPFIDAAWSKNGLMLAGVTNRHSLPLGDPPCQLVVWRSPADMRNLKPGVVADHGHNNFASVAFLPDNSAVVTGSENGVIELWAIPELTSRACKRRFNGNAFGLAVTPDSQTVIVAGHAAEEGHYDVQFIPVSEFRGK